MGIAILVWAIAGTDVPFDEIRFSLGNVTVLVVAQASYLVTESLRMQTVLERAAGMRFERWHMLRLFVMARILNLVVPQSGNVYRVVGVKDRYGAAISETVGGLAGFVWLSVSASLGLSTLLFAAGLGDDVSTRIPAWFALAALTFFAVAAPWVVLSLLSGVKRQRGLVSKLTRAADASLSVARSPRTLVTFGAYWLATIAVIVVMYATAFSMVGPIPSVPTLIAIYALVQATSFVVITPGNIGIQDLGFAAVAVAFGSALGVAAAAALIIRISGITVTVLAGVAAALTSSDTPPSQTGTTMASEDSR
jgi:uncharacterized membrane protein YbhN (UPF0104 family)